MITAFDLRAGMNIAKDNVVAKIQGMDPVWVTAAIPESIARLVKDASQFTLTVPARPDKTLTIRKWTLLRRGCRDPHAAVAPGSRQHRRGAKAGNERWLQLNTASEPMLLIPSQALIDTGSEQRVITVDADGRFVPKRVAVFRASQGVTALRSGLAEGEKVVSSGLFLIDSEANISGALERIRSESATHAH